MVVAIDYLDARGARTRRRVEPIKLAYTPGGWYLAGWCKTRDAVRWFRCERIAGARLTTEPAREHDIAIVGTPPPDAHPVLG